MRFPQTHSQQALFQHSLPPVSSFASSSAITNDYLASQLQENWNLKNPALEHLVDGSKDTCDNSLTSLNWLQNMNLSIDQSTPPSISPRTKVTNNESIRVNPNQVLPTSLIQSSTSTERPFAGYEDLASFEKIDYKSNPYIKPPHSYATLICMAMKSSKKNKVTLAAIYNWITEHFMYYRMADPSWQNSIRHNLSLNKCFQKVPRQKDEPGKGGFWRINPDYNELLDNGVLKKKSKAIEGRTKRGSESMDYSPELGINSKRSRKSVTDEDSEAAMSLAEFLNVDHLLNQDIVVGGMKLRTEDIIDSQDSSENFISLSPLSSSGNTSDSFEELLGNNFVQINPEPQSSMSASELAVQGHKIEPPEWWAESLTGGSLNNFLNNSAVIQNSGDHPWSADKSDIDDAMAELDRMERYLCNSFS